MAKKQENLAEVLKSRGLNCSSLMSMERKQRSDADSQLKDAAKFRSVGFNKMASQEEAIAKAQLKSAEGIAALRKKLCGFR